MARSKNARLVSKLKVVCKEKGVTLYQLTKELGLAGSTLTQIANGLRTPSDDVLVALYDRLGIQPGDILEVLPKPDDASEAVIVP